MQTVVQRFLWVVVVVSGIFSTAMLFFGSQVTGISWDETAHVDDLFGPQRAGDINELHFGIYGVSFQLLGHAAAVLFAGEPLGDTDYQASSFLARHLVSAALTLLAAGATGLMVYVITRRRLLAAWAFAALLAVPVFLGHGMFNPKDIPVAAGYTLVTLGCVSWLNSLTNGRTFGRSVFVQIALIAMGIWIAAGTRYLFLAVILISLLVTIAIGLFIGRHIVPRQRLWSEVFVIGAGGLVGLALLYLTNPCLLMPKNVTQCQFTDLFSRTVSGSSAIAQGQPLFLLGNVYTQQGKPWSALPLNLLAGAPILLWILCFIGLVFVAASLLLRSHALKPSVVNIASGRRQEALLLLPVLLQGVTLPLLTLVSNSSVYDMQRQHLYVYPTVATFAAVGVGYLLKPPANKKRKARVVEAVGLLAFCGAIVIPVYEGFRLFPYNYVYVNPVASVNGFASNWETDYWALSLREAVRKLPYGAPFSIVGPPGSAERFLSEQGLEVVADRPSSTNESFALQIHRPSFGLGKPKENCEIFDSVKRSLRGEDLYMSYVLLCKAEALATDHRIER